MSSLFLKAHAVDIGLAVLFGALGVVVSVGVAALVLVRMPHTYFLGEKPPSLLSPARPAWQRAAAHIGKNILGVVLILLGVILSLPGVPGQGVLTILIGMMLVDFQGKRRLEQRIMRIPSVLRGANTIRARFGKGPFLMNDGEAAAP